MEELVISGLSARLPESSDLNEFLGNLYAGKDMVTSGAGRWPAGLHDLPPRSGKIKEIDRFDSVFFGVHAKQAHRLDPALRILHEVVYEAILDAGVNPTSLRGSNTGVYVALTGSETDDGWRNLPETINGYGLLGCLRVMFANRISYSLDLKGPSIALDTGCSGSLVAFVLAVEAIRSGRCDAAIVGTTNLLLKPESSLQCQRLNMLSADGKCKTFDESGDGYVRSEAVMGMFIQKKDVARRSYGSVLHARSNNDGYKEEGITFPAGSAQLALMKAAYAEAGVDPLSLSYFEAHGTGTRVGDPQELNAIAEMFCSGRESPLPIGSIKSNMGHSEPAAGLCSVLKVLLAMHTQSLPPNLHYENPNPEIPALSDGRFKVPTQNTPWNGGVVGVNSFGFGGANAHVILKSPPRRSVPATHFPLPVLVTVGGRTAAGLRETLEGLAERAGNAECMGLAREWSTVPTPGHNYRGFFTAAMAQDVHIEVDYLSSAESRPRPLWFVFPGMGAQCAGMGRSLLTFPIFRRSLTRSSKILEKRVQFRSLLELVERADETLVTSVVPAMLGIIAIQIGLLDMLRAVGLEPSGLVGHSFGEIGCAYADGCLSAEEALLVAYWRGRSIVEAGLGGGAMAAVGLSVEELSLRPWPNITIASHNAPNSLTISGPAQDVQEFVTSLKADGIFAKRVESCDLAFHSPHMTQAAPQFLRELNALLPAPRPRSPRWISTSLPQRAWNSPLGKWCSAKYQVHNLLAPVRLAQALEHVPDDAVVLEVGPRSLLAPLLRRALPSTTTVLGLRADGEEAVSFLQALGQIYVLGLNPRVAPLYPALQWPVGGGTPFLSPLVRWDHSQTWTVLDMSIPFGSSGDGCCVRTFSLKEAETGGYKGCLLGDIPVLSLGTVLEAVWRAWAKARGVTAWTALPIRFQSLSFSWPVLPLGHQDLVLNISLATWSGEVFVAEASQPNRPILRGFIQAPNGTQAPPNERLRVTSPEQPLEPFLSTRDVYKELRLRGHVYEGEFQNMVAAELAGEWARVGFGGNWGVLLESLFQLHILAQPGRSRRQPLWIQTLSIYPEELKAAGCQAVEARQESNSISCPGVRIHGLGSGPALSLLPAHAPPLLQKYAFVEHLGGKQESGEAALAFCLDLVHENNSEKKLRIVELSSGHTPPLLPHVLTWAQPQVSCQASGTLLTRSEELARTLELGKTPAGMKVVLVGEGRVGVRKDVFLLCTSEWKGLAEAVEGVLDGGFVLIHSTDLQERPNGIHPGLRMVADAVYDQGSYYLYRKGSASSELPARFIEVDESGDWVEGVRAAMGEFKNQDKSAPGGRVHLVAQGQPASGLSGLLNCLKHEGGGKTLRGILNLSPVPLDPSRPNPLLRRILDNDFVLNVVNAEGELGSFRYLPWHPRPSPHTPNAYLGLSRAPDLSSFTWYETPPLLNPISVKAVALTHADYRVAIRKSLPHLSGSLIHFPCKVPLLGSAFAGNAEDGRRLMGLVPAGALATQVRETGELMWEVPEAWSLEEAATVPAAYTTAYSALELRNRFPEGGTVLILGTHPLALAALAIALPRSSALFILTESSGAAEDVQRLFPELPPQTVFDGAEGHPPALLEQVEKATGGQGLDLLITSTNPVQSCAGTDWSRILGKGSRWWEPVMGDPEEQSSGLGVLQGITRMENPDPLSLHEGSLRAALHALLERGLRNGVIRPLPHSTLQPDNILTAFAQLRDPWTSALPVLQIPVAPSACPQPTFSSDRVYVVVGGLGGIGLELISWLIHRGVRRVFIASRSAPYTGYQHLCLRKWREAGASVERTLLDIALPGAGWELVREAQAVMGELEGVFNLALDNEYNLLENHDAASVRKILNPKVKGTLELDAATRSLCPDLKHFVVFSSVLSGRGYPGQGPLGYADAAIERICERRVRDGFRALSAQLCRVGDVGADYEVFGKNDHVNMLRVPSQRLPSLFDTLDLFLSSGETVLAASIPSERVVDGEGETPLQSTVLPEVAQILGMKNFDSANPAASLAELGMDSLMLVQVKHFLETVCDLPLTEVEVRQFSVKQLQELDQSMLSDE